MCRSLLYNAMGLVAFLAFAATTFGQAISSADTATVYSMHGTYYHDRFVGRKTSSGEVFSQDKYTAAHHTLKFGTLLLVTNPKNGKQVIVIARFPIHGLFLYAFGEISVKYPCFDI